MTAAEAITRLAMMPSQGVLMVAVIIDCKETYLPVVAVEQRVVIDAQTNQATDAVVLRP